MNVRVSSLELYQFRNYHTARLELDQRTVLVGPNASGKTNLLEALYVLASTRSFRADREREMILWGESAAKIAADITTDRPHQISVKLALGQRMVSKQFLIDGTKRPAKEVVRTFPMVLFSADDVRLIGGAPGRRRRALDLILNQSLVGYHHAASQYARALASRNRLLEQIQAGEGSLDELDYWDQALAENGQVLLANRREYCDFLNQQLSSIYSSLAVGPAKPAKLHVSYQPIVEQLAHELRRRRNQDVSLGTTSIGPHRDDWAILLGNRPISSFGSSGEFRSAMLAWRIAEVAWITQQLAVRPALLLDDVFSELDEHRRQALLSTLPEGQTILTTPEAEVVPSQSLAGASVYTISELAGAERV